MILGIAIAILFRYFKSEYNIFKKGFTFVTIVNIVSIVLFSIIAQRLYTDKLSFVRLDEWIQKLIVKSPLVDTLMLWIDKIFDFWLIGLIGLAIIVYLYRKKLMYYLTVFVSSMLSALFLFPFIKMIIQRVRPSQALIVLSDYSFPSGHATVSIVVCLLIWYVLQPLIKSKCWKVLFLFLMIAAALLIGISRIVLHVHRFTDVIA
jgi:undecaprenyl-diphosphatase